ncbi:MAG: hypothetical protein K6A62_00990, partial [Bacteroidales bacterium]|nr:hypothetical protein [Bacteroidales bacterium]
MKRYSILGLAAISISFLLVACDRMEPMVPDNGAGALDGARIEKVRLGLEQNPGGTKLDLATTGKISWTEGDRISYCLVSNSGSEYITEPVDPVESAIAISLPTGKTRGGYAIYPAGERWNMTSATPTVTYPASYDLAGQEPATYIPVPMIAVNEPDEPLNFKHVGGMVNLQIAGLPKSYAGDIVVEFANMNVVGTCAVTFSGDVPSATFTPAASNANVVTFSNVAVSATGLVTINVPVPASSSLNMTGITVKYSENSVEKTISATGLSWKTFARARVRVASVARHGFSVAAGRQVVFAPG